MNVAEWILVIFLSVALLIFLILGCVLLAKLIRLTKEAQKIIERGQDIAENANELVNNVKTYTTVSGISGALNSIFKTVKTIKNKRKDN